MSDPIAGLPTPAEPSQPAVPPAPGASQDPTPPAAPSNPSPELATLQAELAAERTRAQNLENLARINQSRADQAANQIRALTQQAPQVDPLAADVAFFTKGGLAPEDAKLVASFVNDKVSGIRQQYEQQHQTLQATQHVNTAFQTAFGANQQLFADPAIQQQAHRALQEAAFHNPNLVTPEYAVAVARQAWADAYWEKQNGVANPNVNPPAPVYQNIPSFMGPTGGYTPAAPAKQQPVSPMAAGFDAELNKHFGIKP